MCLSELSVFFVVNSPCHGLTWVVPSMSLLDNRTQLTNFALEPRIKEHTAMLSVLGVAGAFTMERAKEKISGWFGTKISGAEK